MLDGLLLRLESREARIGIVGLGYVGLPVALTFVEAGFSVLGVDLDEDRVGKVRSGASFLADIPDERIAAATESTRLAATTNKAELIDCDVVLICVPTPLTEDGTPDLSYVVAGGESVAEILRGGMLVVLESTTYPGTTEELLKPILEGKGLAAGTDFYLAYSPERIDPANPAYGFADIPKVVGGIDDASTKAASALYGQVVPKVFTVSSPREAELSKLIENTFRHVNIGLVNELAVYAHDLGIDIWEAIEAAATKPFGFLPFWPGPGWGGHCIPLDPAFLSWRVRRARAHDVRFVELAHTVNSEMPRHVADRASWILNDQGKAIKGARILGIGVAYKGGTEDTRGSPGMKVLSILHKRGADISYHDPLVPEVTIREESHASVDLTERIIEDMDLVIVHIPQQGVDWNLITKAPLILDCCNALGGPSSNIIRL